MNKKVKDKLKSACDHSERQAKVSSILDGIIYPTNEDRKAALDSFVNCKLSVQEIEKIVERLKPDYSTKVSNSNRQTGYSPSGVF